MFSSRFDEQRPWRHGSPVDFAVLGGCLVMCFAIAALGAAVTMPEIPTWYAGLQKPWFNPPNWVFGPVWTILYALIAVALWRLMRAPPHPLKPQAMTLHGLQLLANVSWSFAFFAGHNPGAALVLILVLIGALVAAMRTGRTIDPLANWLLAPYLAWVSFAAILNAAILVLNR